MSLSIALHPKPAYVVADDEESATGTIAEVV